MTMTAKEFIESNTEYRMTFSVQEVFSVIKPNRSQIHTKINCGELIEFGSTYSKGYLKNKLLQSDTIMLAGVNAQNINHGIAVKEMDGTDRYRFIETDRNKLEALVQEKLKTFEFIPYKSPTA